jgi:hypothetical protein
MESLFSPCTRLTELFEDIFDQEYIIGYDPQDINFENFKELNLNVSTEALLGDARGFAYADLCAMLGDRYTATWLTPHAFIVDEGKRTWLKMDLLCHFCFSADGKELVALAREPRHLFEIRDIILRLLAVSVVHSVTLGKGKHLDGGLISAPPLAYLMEQCQSLKVLTLANLKMDEDHCRALGRYSRPDLEIELKDCVITGAAAVALAEVLGRNQGPTKLDGCYIDRFVLANGLRGNSRLKSWRPSLSYCEDGNQEVLAIAGAVKENKGLVDLDLSHDFTMSDEMWDTVCDSLKTHPTLEVLNLCPIQPFRRAPPARPAPTALRSRIQALVDMLKENMSIHTIRLNYRYSQHELFRELAIPYLETNRFRPRLLAIQKTRPILYRTKVLGRALVAARTDANSFWMLLSGNAEVVFPSTATAGTTTAAASLPAATSATAAAISSVAPAVASISTAAAFSVVTPASGQKRKARP